MKRRMQLILGFLLLLVSPVPHFAESYEPQSIETMIEESELIVIAQVEETFVYENEKGDGIRETTIRIQEVIKGEKTSGDIVLVENFEGFVSKGRIGIHSDLRPIFTLGEQTLLLLDDWPSSSAKEIYSVTGSFRGKLDIVEGRIAGTDVALADFIEAIKRVDSKQTSTLEVDMVPIEYQRDKIRAATATADRPTVIKYPVTVVEPTSWGQLKAAVGSTH